MRAVRPRRPLGAAPTLVSARVQQKVAQGMAREECHIAHHDFDDVPDGVGGILVSRNDPTADRRIAAAN